jgi:gamma-glutamylcyclotransferase (GGCT)/AIG2-like uncharacterized protein YtfP
MTDPFFFGYGSLVNRRTHAYPQAEQAHVTGWRRVWRGTTLRKVAFLTVEPDPDAEVSGLIAAVPKADWAALDQRERAYARHKVERIRPTESGPRDIHIYAVEPHLADQGEHPILLSYLDTVIQGYLDEFGVSGARDFFATTGGWHLPILDDRDAPVYPRATPLSPAERAFVDENLTRQRG